MSRDCCVALPHGATSLSAVSIVIFPNHTHYLTVGFILLLYSVVYTVESVPLFYLIFISRFVCTRR